MNRSNSFCINVLCLWCSEGGEDVSNFNNLPRRAKGEVHFAPIGAFQAGLPELTNRTRHRFSGAAPRLRPLDRSGHSGDISRSLPLSTERHQSEATCLRYVSIKHRARQRLESWKSCASGRYPRGGTALRLRALAHGTRSRKRRAGLCLILADETLAFRPVRWPRHKKLWGVGSTRASKIVSDKLEGE